MFHLRHRQVRRSASCLAAALLLGFVFGGQFSASAGMRAIDDRGGSLDAHQRSTRHTQAAADSDEQPTSVQHASPQ
jgi:hypothetical protein